MVIYSQIWAIWPRLFPWNQASITQLKYIVFNATYVPPSDLYFYVVSQTRALSIVLFNYIRNTGTAYANISCRLTADGRHRRDCRVESCRRCERTRRRSTIIYNFLCCWAIEVGEKWRHNDVIVEKVTNIYQNSRSQAAMDWSLLLCLVSFQIVDRSVGSVYWALGFGLELGGEILDAHVP